MSTPRQFRKKPVVIDAVQVDTTDYDGMLDILTWSGARAVGETDGYDDAVMVIDTLEGPMLVRDGDWIIRGVQGEHYPCKPDIFEATYEAANPAVPA